jgi:ketosteroid isomerase-like protein
VDHDLTFDRTAVMLGEKISPAELLQARSPSLDLDSLYGAGPADPESARFYEDDGLHLKMGSTSAAGGVAAKDGFDLPRGEGATAKAKRTAIIPDPRNDENLAVAQTHLAFIRFHNRVVDTLSGTVPHTQLFAEARRLVVKHYQWMLLTDYLPRIANQSVINRIFAKGRKAFEVGNDPIQVPTMPVEFSVAAFRLGHSMIRETYNWNKVFDDGVLGPKVCERLEAAVVEVMGRRVEGRAAIRAWIEQAMPPERRGRHVTVNSAISVDGDGAEVLSDFLFYARVEGGGWEATVAGRYEDELVREGERWLFTRRTIHLPEPGTPSG